jgi:hypothetical protein
VRLGQTHCLGVIIAVHFRPQFPPGHASPETAAGLHSVHSGMPLFCQKAQGKRFALVPRQSCKPMQSTLLCLAPVRGCRILWFPLSQLALVQDGLKQVAMPILTGCTITSTAIPPRAYFARRVGRLGLRGWCRSLRQWSPPHSATTNTNVFVQDTAVADHGPLSGASQLRVPFLSQLCCIWSQRQDACWG